ncbi:MAG: hypothetical protein ACI4IS_08030 [Acutalibacteraceae bacterium]
MSASLTKGSRFRRKVARSAGVLWVMHKTHRTIKVLVKAQSLCYCVGYADSFSAKSTIPKSKT